MRLEIGGRVDCSDGTFGEFADVVIDPTTKQVTHLVVKAEGQPSVERLVPIELADRGDGTRRVVTLRATAKEVGSLPPVQEVAYVQLGDFPLDDPDWDVGIKEVYALPYYPAYDLAPGPVDVSVVYDRTATNTGTLALSGTRLPARARATGPACHSRATGACAQHRR